MLVILRCQYGWFFLFLGLCLRYRHWGQRPDLKENLPLKVALAHLPK